LTKLLLRDMIKHLAASFHGFLSISTDPEIAVFRKRNEIKSGSLDL